MTSAESEADVTIREANRGLAPALWTLTFLPILLFVGHALFLIFVTPLIREKYWELELGEQPRMTLFVIWLTNIVSSYWFLTVPAYVATMVAVHKMRDRKTVVVLFSIVLLVSVVVDVIGLSRPYVKIHRKLSADE